MNEIGKKKSLGVSSQVVATAHVLFHRFFSRRPMQTYDPTLVASTCLFLACKITEERKKISELITHVIARINKTSASSSSGKGGLRSTMEADILNMERVLLHTLAFELSIDLPFPFLQTFARSELAKYAPAIAASDVLLHNLLIVASALLNDSQRTNLCLQYPAKTIAMGALYTAALFMKDPVVFQPNSHGKQFFEKAHVHPEDMLDAAQTIMRVYTYDSAN